MGVHELFAMAGRRADSYAASFQMQLWAGGTVSGGNVTGGTLLASVDFDHSSTSPSTFTSIQVSYVATPTDAHLGELLTVRFQKSAGVQMNFDDVRLNPVPEPATAAGLVVALGGLLVRRRGLKS